MAKLYEIPRHSKFRIVGNGDSVFTLERIDGMFSVCKNSNDEIVHISATANVIIL